MALNKSAHQNIEKITIFVSGVVISGLASGLLDKTITWSVTMFVATIIVLALASMFVSIRMSERVQSLADSMETSVRYVEEPFRESHGIIYRGIVFDALTKLVADAEFEILALSAGNTTRGEAHKTDEHLSRNNYLLLLEGNIKRHQSKQFKYVRILQAPPGTKADDINKNLARLTVEHCQRILGFAKTNESLDLTLAIMAIENQITTSLMIIDRRHVVIEIDAMDTDGITYAVGLLFIEDRGGKFIQKFLHYFGNYERRAKELTLADFDPDGKQAMVAPQIA